TSDVSPSTAEGIFSGDVRILYTAYALHNASTAATTATTILALDETSASSKLLMLK
ncbi:hypothetical protein L9F63_026597, partial [Diploptera punctata]